MWHYDIAPLPGYPEDIGLLLAALQDSTREWRGELGEPDIETIVWQPYPRGYSVGAQLLHIGEAELYWVNKICLGRDNDPEDLKRVMSAEIDQDAGLWPTPYAEPIAFYYDLLDDIRARTLESAKRFEPGAAVKQHHNDTVTFRWILAHLIQHDSYHGGQAVMMSEIAKRLRPT